MKMILPLLLLLMTNCDQSQSQDTQNSVSSPTTSNDYIALSQDLLQSLRNGESGDEYVAKYGEIDLQDLVESLDTKAKKLAFWINTYNGLVQYRLVPNPELFEDKDAFFKNPWVNIGGVTMSYDDIEHGIIRNSRVKLGLGYLKRWFVPKWQRQLRNTEIDGRIHFTLNCGAKSCPYIAMISDQDFDSQMDRLAKHYLKEVSQVEGDVVKSSPLFSWFRGDFGGKNGAKRMLERYDIIDSAKDSELEFLGYDWTVETGNYIDL